MHASREELLAVVFALERENAEQQKTILAQGQIIKGFVARVQELEARIVELEAQIRQLEARLSKGGQKGMPGTKPESKDPAQPKKPRKRRPHGFARRRAVPDEQVFHAVERCPKCDVVLKGEAVKYRRQVIELPVVPVRVVEHVFIERQCPLCGARLVPKDALAGVVVGKQRLGANVVSLISTLREEGRLPVRVIQWYLKTFHRLPLSVGGIVGVVQGVAARGEKALSQTLERVRASPVVGADETGWREDGTNGYIWTFSTEKERYFVRRGRNKEVVDEVLGEEFSGVLVTDFYAAYNHYAGLHQRCWSHLLRDIHDLKQLYPDDEGLGRWAEDVHAVYVEAKAYSNPKGRERWRAKERFEQRLLPLCQPFVEDKGAAQRLLCKRISNFLSELFVFVAYPEVPSDNNGAERSLRHLVTSRKISGGTRSQKGSDTKMALASLFGTWRAQGINPFFACRKLLISSQI
jgi:transposase